MISPSLRQAVRTRAEGACEYCRAAEKNYKITFHIEHIIARKHGGLTELENLALSCHLCNRYKGPNLSGIDPQTQLHERLFHPRRDKWLEHFRLSHGILVGITSVGRTTVQVLNINSPERVRSRNSVGISIPVSTS